ncbi:MAG: DNA-processing protein DprA [Verrucomicrobiota bacterium]|jgi:predicted Rossmann fold nucleotide-binding protein DprA/Smf involved in DNA uptake
MTPLTPNTQAILLLTAPLVAGRGDLSAKLFSLGEYNRLARLLREKQKQPADLIGTDANELISVCARQFGKERLETLLGRGFLLSQAVERWSARSIWVISRADSLYPKRLKTRLKEDAPPLLYGCGDLALLEKGGLAVVGSRHVDEELVSYTEGVGKLAAEAHRTLISGGAKGIDRAAISGVLQSGGEAVAVMSDSLERAAITQENREPLIDRRLVLVSPFDPAAGFNVGNAMQRNKVIYAIADAGLVVTSDFEKGGTWAGAIEQLEKFHFVPVFVRNGSHAGRGNSALIHHGGLPWPNPQSGSELAGVLLAAIESVAAEPKQKTLSFALREQPPAYQAKNAENNLMAPQPEQISNETNSSPAEILFNAVRKILKRELTEARTEKETAEMLDVSKTQAKAWLTKLVDDGEVERTAKPVRYRAAGVAGRLL